MTEMTTATDAGWLTPEEMDSARERLPILYVDVVPVRVDVHGTVTRVGLLLRAGEDGQIKRALISGRVLYHAGPGLSGIKFIFREGGGSRRLRELVRRFKTT